MSVQPATSTLPASRRTDSARSACAASLARRWSSPVVAMAMLIWEVARGARLSFSTFGLGFITSTDWNVVTNQFGALYLLEGTL